MASRLKQLTQAHLDLKYALNLERLLDRMAVEAICKFGVYFSADPELTEVVAGHVRSSESGGA